MKEYDWWDNNMYTGSHVPAKSISYSWMVWKFPQLDKYMKEKNRWKTNQLFRKNEWIADNEWNWESYYC